MTIKDIEDRLAAATPGPWGFVKAFVGQPKGLVARVGMAVVINEAQGAAAFDPTADAAFISSAPSDIRLLLDVAKAATEFREDCQHLRSGDSGKRMFAALDALENDV